MVITKGHAVEQTVQTAVDSREGGGERFPHQHKVSVGIRLQ